VNGRGSGARAARAAAAAGAVACLTAAAGAQGAPPGAVAGARQLVVVAASGWDDTTATLRRYARAARGAWRPVGAPVAVTLGRSGLAWGVGQGAAPNGAPVKREGDGRSPAGAYPLSTVSDSPPTRPRPPRRPPPFRTWP
jgi:D-alanyl-D-alanine dipeptidase